MNIIARLESDLSYYWFGCFNGISTFLGHLILKTSFEKNSSGTIQPIAGGMCVHAFPKGICSKVNVIVYLEFEFAY